ncbi:hypothetical protein PG990_011466 [Apiospora arundinis]
MQLINLGGRIPHGRRFGEIVITDNTARYFRHFQLTGCLDIKAVCVERIVAPETSQSSEFEPISPNKEVTFATTITTTTTGTASPDPLKPEAGAGAGAGPTPQQQPPIPRQQSLQARSPLIPKLVAPPRPVAVLQAIPKAPPPQQPYNVAYNPQAAAPIQQKQALQPPQITRKPLIAAAAAQPSVLARELGDNTRTYLPGVQEVGVSVGNNNNNNNVNNANPSGPLAAAAAAAVVAPSVLGRELGDNTRTYLQGVWETGGSSGPPQRGNNTSIQGRQRAFAAGPAPTVLNRSIGDMSRTNIPMVREVDGVAEYDADIDAVGRHVNRIHNNSNSINKWRKAISRSKVLWGLRTVQWKPMGRRRRRGTAHVARSNKMATIESESGSTTTTTTTTTTSSSDSGGRHQPRR